VPRRPRLAPRAAAVLAVAAFAAAKPAGAQVPPPAPPAPAPAPAPAPTPSAPTAPANPCLRPELALRCPDLVMRRPYAFALRHTPSGHAVLAATSAVVNVGDGPLELRGRRVTRTRMQVRQVLRSARTGRPRVEPHAGTIEYYDTRSRGVYWKYRHAARFELWRMDAHGNPVEHRRDGPKLDYCFRDLRRVHSLADHRPYARSPRARRFGACDQAAGARAVTLGTSVGWADIYPAGYPQNWISVAGLRGCFLYVLRADPEDLLFETREDDNAAARVVRLPWRGEGRRGCPAPTRMPGR
jgi:hypothetical protein